MTNDAKSTMLQELEAILQTRFAGVQSKMSRAAGVSLPQLNRMLKGKMPVSETLFDRIKQVADLGSQEPVRFGDDEQAKAALYEYRRVRLNEIIDSRFAGVNLRFAKAVDMAIPSAHGIVNGHRNIGEKLARRLERLLSLPPGDMDGLRAIADIDEKDRFCLRRERLQQMVKEVFGGNVAACAQHIDANEAFLHQMLSGLKNVGQMTVRNIERRLLLEAGAFDRLEEIAFPVQPASTDGRGIELKLALLLTLLQEHPVDQKTRDMLHGVVDVAIERLKFSLATNETAP